MEVSNFIFVDNVSDIAGLLFCGAVFILSVFMLLIITQNKEKIYKHYAAFLILMLFYGIIHLESINLFSSYPADFKNRLVEPVTILSFSFYIFFTLELLELKKNHRKLFTQLAGFGYLTVVYAILHYLLYESFKNNEETVFLIARAFIFPAAVYFLSWIQLKVKSPLKLYFILGSIAYFIGSVISTIRYGTEDFLFDSFYIFTHPVYCEIGISIEILCFALALSYRIKHLHKTKEEANTLLIQQYTLNEKMVKEMNSQLEAKVEQRAKEILLTQSELREQEKKRLIAEFEKDLAKSETLARSLQIDPHFIFNTLNAIKYLIQNNQNQEASRYLVTFSKFIRKVLDSSQKSTISLQEEIEMIKDYVEIEKKRFNNNFTVDFKETTNTDFSQVFIPPLILQPFVENAIWHGLLNSTLDVKEIKINIQCFDKEIIITIEDNGIGRDEAKKYSVKRLQKSLGIPLTEERLKLHNHNYGNRLNFKIIDKIDKNNLPLGTKVEVTIDKGIKHELTNS